MPKKTYKQKIVAQRRRQLNYIRDEQKSIQVDPAGQVELIRQTPKTPAKPEVHMPSYSAAYTIADLKKTFIISAILFTLEILVFYAILKGIILGRS